MCRQPAGRFTYARTLPIGNLVGLTTGELDGEPGRDLVTTTLDGELAVTFGGPKDGAFEPTRRLGSRGVGALVGELTGDARDDVAHLPTGGVGVVESRLNRELKPVAYAPVRAKGILRFDILDVLPPDPPGPSASEVRSKFLALDEVALLDDKGSFRLPLFNKLDASPFQLVDEPSKLLPVSTRLVHARLGGPASPCEHLVLAVAGKSEVVLHPTCTLATGVQNPSAADSPRFRLPEKRTVAHGVLVTDVDGDGLLDVVVGASEPGAAEVRPLYVAFGQGDGSMASAPPAATPNLALPRLAVRLDLDAGTFPLAAGDLNDDGKADFVFPGLVAMSAPCKDKLGVCYLDVELDAVDIDQAGVADVNGNGKADLVVTARANRAVTFYEGTGSTVLTRSDIPLSGRPQRLAIADFDGDLVNDIAIAHEVERGPGAPSVPACPPGAGANTLSILYGATQGPPAPALDIGEFRCILGLATGDLAWRGLDGASELGVAALDGSEIPIAALFTGSSRRLLQSPFHFGDEILGLRATASALVRPTASHPSPTLVALFHSRKTTGGGGKGALLGFAEVGVGASVDPVAGVQFVDLDGLALRLCTTALIPYDLGSDGTIELLLVAKNTDRDAVPIHVARRSSSGAWTLDPKPLKFDGLEGAVSTNAVEFCTAEVGEPSEGLADAQGTATFTVADLDGNGKEDLAFLVRPSAKGAGNREPQLIVIRDGEPAKVSTIDLDAQRHARAFALLQLDDDPALEVVFATRDGLYAGDLELEPARFVERPDVFPPAHAAKASDSGTDATATDWLATAGDLDGDGIDDVAVGRATGVELFLGEARKP